MFESGKHGNRIIFVTKNKRQLKTSDKKVVAMILNNTMPIGAVAEPEQAGAQYTTRIPKKRWEKWLAGEDIR